MKFYSCQVNNYFLKSLFGKLHHVQAGCSSALGGHELVMLSGLMSLLDRM